MVGWLGEVALRWVGVEVGGGGYIHDGGAKFIGT